MIYECLQCIAEECNDVFRHKFHLHEDKVIVSGIVSQDGTNAIQGENKLIVTLLNITKEMRVQQPGSHTALQKSISSAPSSLSVNLSVLISAYFSPGNYSEALRFLSDIMSFFHDKSVFTLANTPKLPNKVHKLVVELDSLSPDRLNHIWATLGAKYMPSLVYKIRMLTYESSMPKEFIPAVTGISNDKLR